MPQYEVEIMQTLYRYRTVSVQADSEDYATEAALDEIYREDRNGWTEKVQDNSVRVREKNAAETH